MSDYNEMNPNLLENLSKCLNLVRDGEVSLSLENYRLDENKQKKSKIEVSHKTVTKTISDVFFNQTNPYVKIRITFEEAKNRLAIKSILESYEKLAHQHFMNADDIVPVATLSLIKNVEAEGLSYYFECVNPLITECNSDSITFLFEQEVVNFGWKEMDVRDIDSEIQYEQEEEKAIMERARKKKEQEIALLKEQGFLPEKDEDDTDTKNEG